MRGLPQPPNAEGSSNATETEEQTTRGEVQGDYTRRAKGEGTQEEEEGVIAGDSETPSSRLFKKTR